MFRLWIVCLLLCASPLSAQAKLYKVVDKFGNITFTDTAPSIDAKEHKLGLINAVDNPAFNMDKLTMLIPYLDEQGTMLVRGAINGVSVRFIVDTGASMVAVPESVAKAAGLYKLESKTVSVQTANGKINAPQVVIKSLTVAKVEASNIKATIQTFSKDKPNYGLLGMSFFNRYKMSIDHDKKEIRLEKK